MGMGVSSGGSITFPSSKNCTTSSTDYKVERQGGNRNGDMEGRTEEGEGGRCMDRMSKQDRRSKCPTAIEFALMLPVSIPHHLQNAAMSFSIAKVSVIALVDKDLLGQTIPKFCNSVTRMLTSVSLHHHCSETPWCSNK